MAVDYGHWDATLRDCVKLVSGKPDVDTAYAVRLLSSNALEFYGDRLRSRVGQTPVAAGLSGAAV